MTRARGTRLTLATMAAALLLSACGGGGGSDSTDTSGGNKDGTSTTAAATASADPTVPSGSTTGGSKGGRVRVLNAFVQNGKPGPAIDLYETFMPGEDDEPLISNLKWGELSDYVQPRGLGGDGNLTMFPTGTKTKSDDPSEGAGQSISNAGFAKGTQRTLVIGTGKAYDNPDNTQPSFQEILEIGTDDQPTQDAWNAIEGKGLLLGNVAGAGLDYGGMSFYLAVDGTCPKRVDAENSAGGSVESLANGNAVPFEVEPGRREITLLTAPYDNGLSTCDLSAKATTKTVDVPEGGRVEVFVLNPTGKAADSTLLTAEVPD